MKKRKTKKQKVEVRLSKEVATLANQVVTAMKSTVTSKDVKAIRDEALGGVRATGSRLVKALRKAKEGQAAQDIKAQSQRVLELGKKRTELRTRNLRVNLAKGLASIGQELQNLSSKLHKK